MHEYEYETMYGLEDSYWWFVARRILAEELIGGEVNGRREPRLLDIGCGTGANMKTFGRHGMTAGIDTSIEALHFCQKRGLQTVAVSAVERLPFDDGSFDVITALDVLEHTDDDLDALREIRRVARDEAMLLIAFPAYGFLWSEHDEALKHRRRYTAYELRNKLTVTGYEVVRTSYFITTLFFPILALRFWQGLFKKSTHPKTSLKILPAWLNESLIGLLWLERQMLKWMNFPFGVSVIALARPSRPLPTSPASGRGAKYDGGG